MVPLNDIEETRTWTDHSHISSKP